VALIAGSAGDREHGGVLGRTHRRAAEGCKDGRRVARLARRGTGRDVYR